MIRSVRPLPDDRVRLAAKARRLAWTTIVVQAVVVGVVAVVMGTSQAMKAVWLEDMLGLVPASAFLLARRFERKGADAHFPYGRTRANAIAFLSGSLAILGMGLFILVDSLHDLMKREHPAIGLVFPFGREVWSGWLMIAALVITSIPIVILGRAKRPLAEQLHEKPLHADAEMQRADWMTAAAGVVGLVGVAAGLWWADAAAAAVIGVEVLRDGARNTRVAVGDLMDAEPRTVESNETDPIIDKVRSFVLAQPWVREADVRLREHGHHVVGEVYVVAKDGAADASTFAALARAVKQVHWRLDDVVCAPVPCLPH
jgi:divalent metal cation (Fe/Co/Zn/Cd) transporter